ncbi:MAG: hypothetical protein SH818_06610 [Saprospiraceae bacterium]|nr:hypothetical protein [Saprospiraceae bacterium]
MNTKTLVAAVLGGLASFFGGWLLYGILLKSTMESMMGTATGVMKTDAEMMTAGNMITMFLGSLVMGYLLAYIFGKWATISTAMVGAVAGATIMGLVALGYDLQMYASTNIMQLPMVFIDTLVNAVLGALSGAVIAWWLGRK